MDSNIREQYPSVSLTCVWHRLTCVVFPEPVSPSTSSTLLSLMSCIISSCLSRIGRECLKVSSSVGLLLLGTIGIPLFKRPLALFLSQLPSEESEHHQRMWNTGINVGMYTTLWHWPESEEGDMLLLLPGCRSKRSLLLTGNLCRRLRMKNIELWERVSGMVGRGLSELVFFLMVRKRCVPFLKNTDTCQSLTYLCS